jgi:hypothetical protein
MTVAQIQRPWQFCLNAILGSSPTAAVWPPQYLAPIIGKNTMLYLKDALKGAGSWTDLEGNATTSAGNWTVVSSCDGSGGAGSFGNGDGVDRWADVGDLIWAAAASNHSWIVLAQPGISTNFEICIDLVTPASEYNCTIVMAPNQRFGVAGGGTAGTATARPTAGTSGTGEVVVRSAAAYGALSDLGTQRVHVMKSSDGAATRVLFTRGGFVGGAWFFEVPANTPEGWEYPVIGLVTAVAGTNISSSQLESGVVVAANWKGLTKYPSGVTFSALLSTANAGGYAYENIYTPDDLGGQPTFYPGTLIVKDATTTVGSRAAYGTLVDCYFAPAGAPDGLTYPADGSREWVQTGRLVMPWNKSPNIWY